MIKWYFRKLLPTFIWILIICKKLDATVAHGDAAIATAVAPAAATAPAATVAAVDAINDEDVQVKQPLKLVLHFHYGVRFVPFSPIFQTNFALLCFV